MSDTARVVVGWGAFVVGGLTANPGLMMWGASMALQVGVNKLFEPSGTPTASGRENGRLLNILSNEAPVGIVYGRTKVGVQVLDVRVHPSDSDLLYVVAAIALGSEDGSGVEDVDEIYFDERLAISNPDFESEPSTTGVQTAFAGKLSYGLHRGADAQAVDAELDSVFSAYDADTAGRGVAYIMLKLTYDPNVYPTGVPNITAIVKGQRVWDPRGTPAWAYSDSPALCILDYLTSKRYGAGVLYGERDGGASEIDEQSFIDAANYHDDTITMGTGTGTRFICNGRLDTGRPIERNLTDLLSSCRSELIYEGGKFRLVTPQVQSPETFELTPENIIGEVEYWRGGTDEVPNRVICHYVDESNEWLPQEVAWPEPTQSNAFLSADNDFENVLELALPFTVGHYRAQHIGMVLLREAREDTGIILNTTEEGLKLRVGEVVRVTLPRAGFTQAEFRVRAIGLTQDNLTRLALAEYDDDAYTLDAQVTRDTLPASSLPAWEPLGGNLVHVISVEPSFSSDGQLSVAITVDDTSLSVRVAAAVGSDPSLATIGAATAQNVDADGFVRVTGLGMFASTEVAHIGVIAYSQASGAGTAFDVFRSRATPTTGQAGNTDSVDDAPSNEVARSVQSGIVSGPDADGLVAVTFPLAYNAAPVVVIKQYRVKSFDSGLGSGSDQTLVLEAIGVAATGFTLRAVLIGGVPTLVADGDDFAASSDLDAVNETVECNLASLAAAGAYGDAYTIHYSVALQVTADPGDTFYRATVVVAFDSNDGGGWVERATASYQLEALGSTENLTVSHATKVINVSGLGTNDDIRIRIKSITELGDGGIDSLNVHGFNVATNGDAAEGVTWQEETVAATEVSAIDDASHFVAWEAKSAT